MSDPRIIVALDLPSRDEARALVDTLGDAVEFYKVGLELYIASGGTILADLQALGKRIFLDLKFHDIGETVKRATAAAAQSGASFLTVHAVPQVVRAAVEGRAGSPLKILAVTVLTSLDDRDLHEMGYRHGVRDAVELRARQAIDGGADGLVCSPLEVAHVREVAGPWAILATPGVRPAGAETGDQKRIATPEQALADGATHLVIGRPITRAAHPRAAALAIVSALRPT
ncbi:MAG: orotidine-5'-phosphate decarboxylase [Bryobacteraceae bacterium]|nr:orotidine-5'-phosphate decarboxylase [Bryobacteraceae bacterium]